MSSHLGHRIVGPHPDQPSRPCPRSGSPIACGPCRGADDPGTHQRPQCELESAPRLGSDRAGPGCCGSSP